MRNSLESDWSVDFLSLRAIQLVIGLLGDTMTPVFQAATMTLCFRFHSIMRFMAELPQLWLPLCQIQKSQPFYFLGM
jgi:hypothetical protein